MFRGCFTVVERKNIKKLMINGELVIGMKLLVKKNTQCYGNENRNQNKKEIDYGILTVNIYDFILDPQILEK